MRSGWLAFTSPRKGRGEGASLRCAAGEGRFHALRTRGSPSPGVPLTMQSDLSPQGRGKKATAPILTRLALAQPHSDLSIFQNTGVAGPPSTPVSDFRHALGAMYCPSGI